MGRIAGVAATDGRDATVRSMLGAAGCTAATVIDGMAATADAGLAEAGPHVLAWDGRMYNPEEFPAPPEGGSEAPRVLAAILRLGPDAALARLNADFALALLDRRDGRLLLARDRFAIRPLYHARAGLAPAFASRPASLLVAPGIDLVLNRGALAIHAAGNYRILTGMAAELLATAAQQDLPQLDEKLYLQVYAQPERNPARRAGAPR